MWRSYHVAKLPCGEVIMWRSYWQPVQATVLQQNIQVFCLGFLVLHCIILLSGSKSVKLA